MEFRILGPLEVLDGGTSLPLGGPRQRAVLALLLVRAGETVPADRLVEELWTGEPPPTAGKTLRVYVSRLRKLLPGRIETRANGYRIRVEPGELDVDRFVGLREEARELGAAEAASRLREALALCRGDPLVDFAYEPWAQDEVARIDELRVACLEERIEADLALGRHRELVGELERLIGKHPLRERLRGQLMLCLYRSGRQAEALQAYQRARSTLVDELGIDPSPELQRLERAILQQDPALAAPEALAPPEPAAAAVAPRRHARKTVTVVFVDLADSTALGEDLDPEALRGVLSRYLETVAAAVRAHGGSVEKFIGDAVLAVFGVPIVREDDAIRALAATLDIQAGIERLSDELEPAIGIRLAVRIGINTGEVLASEGEGGPSVTGDVVNVAAGIQQAAKPGETLLASGTVALVRGRARLEAAGALVLKRRREPVEVARLVELARDADVFAGQLTTPLVGRSSELAQLGQAFNRAVETKTACLFTILGPAGVGKSRLVAELTAMVEPAAAVLAGRCLSYGEGITFWPLAEIVAKAVGERTQDALAQELAPDEEAESIAEHLASLLGFGERSIRAEDGFWAARRFLEALAKRRPLVAVFEDIHWAEPALLDLIEHMAEWTRDAPILIVCLARTELLDERPSWGGGKLNASSILLEPLSERQCQELIDSLGGRILGPETRSRIAHASEGNPLFVEQMVALAVDDPAGISVVPPTIQAVLAARLDGLPAEERALLERAAVEGKEFHVDALRALAPDADASELAGTLQRLVRKELIRPTQPTLPRHEAYAFRHVLLRDAAYSALPKSERVDLHVRFADWLDLVATDRADDFDEIVGYHLEQGTLYTRELGLHEERSTKLARRAGALLGSAGRRARARGDASAAASLLGRARPLLAGPDDALRRELTLDLGGALLDVGRLEEALDLLREVEADAETAGDLRVKDHASLARLYAEVYREPEGKAAATRSAALRAIPRFERLGDEVGLARAWRLVAESCSLTSNAAEMEEAAREMERHAEQAGDAALAAMGVTMQIGAIVFGPRPVPEGIRLVEAMLARPLPLRRLEAVALRELAVLRAMNGEVETARELLARARATFEELGLRLALAVSGNRGGLIELAAGELEAAEADFRHACELLAEMGDVSYLPGDAAYLALTLVEQGRVDEADELAATSEAAAATDDLLSQTLWRQARAAVLAWRRQSAAADGVAREAVRYAEQTDFLHVQGDARTLLARILAGAGRHEEAVAAARQALSLYDRKGHGPSAARVRTLLEELSAAVAR